MHLITLKDRFGEKINNYDQENKSHLGENWVLASQVYYFLIIPSQLLISPLLNVCLSLAVNSLLKTGWEH